MTSTRPRPLLGVVATALALLVGLTLGGPPPAIGAQVDAPTIRDGDLDFSVVRIGGSDRYAVSARTSARFFPSGVPVAYVASGAAFPDALGAGPAAARSGAPVLLVRPDSIPTAVRTELARLRPARIVVVGGEGAVSADVLDALRAHTAGTVTRLAGTDRFATSVALSRAIFSTSPIVYVATGRAYPDALSAGAAAAVQNAPLLVSDTDDVPDDVLAEIRRLRPERIMLIGGSAALTDRVAGQLREIALTERIGGSDRYAVSRALSQRVFGPDRPGVVIATGSTFPDALSAVPVTTRTRGPILLSRTTQFPSGAELDRLTPGTAYLMGGTAALSHDVARAVQRERGVCWSGPVQTTASQQVLTQVGGTASRKIAFTLDMGGRLQGATQIVDLLVEEQVCTTFFPTSAMAETSEGRAVMAKIAAHPELFEVGNHTVHHCDLANGGGGASCPATMTSAFVRSELSSAEPVLERLSGMETRPYWRPPYGAHNAWVRDQAAAVGYPLTVMWARDTIDWDPATTTAQIVSRTTSPLPESGSIVLAHLGGYKTLEALPQIITVLRDNGYTMTTLSDMRDG